MKQIILLIGIFWISFFFTSCTKEKAEDPNDCKHTCGEFISMGSLCGNVVELNHTHEVNSGYLDINNDGVDDLRKTHYFWESGPPLYGWSRSYGLEVLNGAEVLGIITSSGNRMLSSPAGLELMPTYGQDYVWLEQGGTLWRWCYSGAQWDVVEYYPSLYTVSGGEYMGVRIPKNGDYIYVWIHLYGGTIDSYGYCDSNL